MKIENITKFMNGIHMNSRDRKLFNKLTDKEKEDLIKPSKLPYVIQRDCTVTQRLECEPYKLEVDGSTPSGATKK